MLKITTANNENLGVDEKFSYVMKKCKFYNIPKIYEQEHNPDPMIYARFFTQHLEWFVIEFDGANTCCGFVKNNRIYPCMFSLSDLAKIAVEIAPLTISLDINFKPALASEIL